MDMGALTLPVEDRYELGGPVADGAHGVRCHGVEFSGFS